MTLSALKVAVIVGATSAFLTGCASVNPFAKPDERWADFKSWTKITEGHGEPTGDPSKLLGTVHKGEAGYRDVYVNDIGKEAILGSAPYNFPVGTVVVKHQFDNKADWEAGKGDVTVSIKTADEGERNKDNWVWAAGMKGKAGPSEFCSGCHTAALSLYDSDYVFTTAGFFEKHSAK